MKCYVLIVALGMLSSCSSLPKTEAVVGFGSAVNTGAKAIRQVGFLSGDLVVALEKEVNVRLYICGEPNFQFVTLNNTKGGIDPKEINFRAQQLEALGAYGAALTEAADSTNIDKLADAANNLITAVTSLGSAMAPGAGAVFTPLGKVVGKAVGLTAKNRYAKEVNGIIAATDPYVQNLIALLKTDMGKVANTNASLRDTLLGIRQANLNYMRIAAVEYPNPADDKSTLQVRCPDQVQVGLKQTLVFKEEDRGLAYDRYMAMVKLQAETDATVKSAKQSLDVLEKIAKSHHSLAEDSEKTTSDVRELLAATGGLVELIAAAKKGN